jgi:hypothetical protein
MTSARPATWTRYLPTVLLLGALLGLGLAGWGYVAAAWLSVADDGRELHWRAIAIAYGYAAIGALLLAALGAGLRLHAPHARRVPAQMAFAAGLLGFGLAKLLANALLLLWVLGSAGQSDIAARGPWLLAVFLRPMVLVSVAATLAVVALLTGARRRSLLARLWPAVLGAGVGGLLLLSGADPIALLFRFVPWPAAHWSVLTSLLAASLIILAGVRLVRRSPANRHHSGDAPVTA